MSHLGPSVYRFAKKHRELLCSGTLFVEFWKHCLNQVQYRTIDAECLRVVMEVVKGGKDEWSSVGKTKCGVGLKGSHVLDEPNPSPPTSPLANRRRSSMRRPGRAAREDPMDIDSDSPWASQPSQDKKQKQPAEEPAEKTVPSYGICGCRGPWDRTEMVLCRGKVRFPDSPRLTVKHSNVDLQNCSTRWFHRSCYQLDRWTQYWVCPECVVAEQAKFQLGD